MEPEETVSALDELIEIAMEATNSPVEAIGLLECAKHAIHQMMSRQPNFEEIAN